MQPDWDPTVMDEGYHRSFDQDARSVLVDAFRSALSVRPSGPLELIDWTTIHDRGEAIVDGLVIPGRWTAIAAKAKAGKTTLEMFATVEVSEGRDPFDGTRCDPVTVLYVDGEMGRFDLEQRLHELGHPHPDRLRNWHATDLPPRLDTIEGGAVLLDSVRRLGAQVVVIDGINGTVSGAEKDDTVWRAFYDFTVFPLKREGVAVVTGDNLGKDETLGPRGSSVKVDKPDAVIRLARTDDGVKLTTTHRRTSEYASELLLTLTGLDGSAPIRYRRAASAWPAGTMEAVELLDRLAIPTNLGRAKVREAIGQPIRNEVLAAAIRYRKANQSALSILTEAGPS